MSHNHSPCNKSLAVIILIPLHEELKRWGTLCSYYSICSTHAVHSAFVLRDYCIQPSSTAPLIRAHTPPQVFTHGEHTFLFSCITCIKHTSEGPYCCFVCMYRRGACINMQTESPPCIFPRLEDTPLSLCSPVATCFSLWSRNGKGVKVKIGFIYKNAVRPWNVEM